MAHLALVDRIRLAGAVLRNVVETHAVVHLGYQVAVLSLNGRYADLPAQLKCQDPLVALRRSPGPPVALRRSRSSA